MPVLDHWLPRSRLPLLIQRTVASTLLLQSYLSLGAFLALELFCWSWTEGVSDVKPNPRLSTVRVSPTGPYFQRVNTAAIRSDPLRRTGDFVNAARPTSPRNWL